MSTLRDKLNYLKGTKTAIKNAINEKGVEVTESNTFREYADKILLIERGQDEPDPMPAFRGLYLPQFEALKGTIETSGSIFSVQCKDISQVKSDLISNPTNEDVLNIQTSETNKVGVGIVTNSLNKEMILNNTFKTVVASMGDKSYEINRHTLRKGEVNTAGWCINTYNTQTSVPSNSLQWVNSSKHTAYFSTSNNDVINLMKNSKLTVYRDYCVEFGNNKFSDYVNFNTIINPQYNERALNNTHNFDRIMLEFDSNYLYVYYIASDVEVDYNNGNIYFNKASLDANNASILRGRYTCSSYTQDQTAEALTSIMVMVNPDGTDMMAYSAKTNNNYVTTTADKIIATFDIPNRNGGNFVTADFTFDELNQW